MRRAILKATVAATALVVCSFAAQAHAQTCTAGVYATPANSASPGDPVTVDLPGTNCVSIHEATSVGLSNVFPTTVTGNNPSHDNTTLGYYQVTPTIGQRGHATSNESELFSSNAGLAANTVFKSLALNIIQLPVDSAITFIGTQNGQAIDESFSGDDLNYYLGSSFKPGVAGSDSVEFSFNGASITEVLFNSGSASPTSSLEFNLISVSAAPEPAAWALMLIGIGGLGLALRRKPRLALAAA